MVRRRTIICADSRGFAKDGNTSGCACGVGQGSGEVWVGRGRRQRDTAGLDGAKWNGMGRVRREWHSVNWFNFIYWCWGDHHRQIPRSLSPSRSTTIHYRGTMTVRTSPGTTHQLLPPPTLLCVPSAPEALFHNLVITNCSLTHSHLHWDRRGYMWDRTNYNPTKGLYSSYFRIKLSFNLNYYNITFDKSRFNLFPARHNNTALT